MNPKRIRSSSLMWVDPVSQKKSIKEKILGTIAVQSFALFVLLGVAWQAQAQDAKTLYPSMAPLEQYLIADPNAEIALARSAAPESISSDAEVLVLGPNGYETAVKGKNGFVCIVERGHGPLESTIQTFGTLSSVVPSASTAGSRTILSSTDY